MAILTIIYSYNYLQFKDTCSEDKVHANFRYTESSAAWVLIAAIIVFFMVCIANY